MELSLLLICRRCCWFRLEWGPAGSDRSAAVVWTRCWVHGHVLQVPVVDSFLFDTLGCQYCRAIVDTGPQGCHVAGRICGLHDDIVCDQGIEVGLPFGEQPGVGWGVAVSKNQLRRFLQPLLSPNCGSC